MTTISLDHLTPATLAAICADLRDAQEIVMPRLAIQSLRSQFIAARTALAANVGEDEASEMIDAADLDLRPAK